MELAGFIGFAKSWTSWMHSVLPVGSGVPLDFVDALYVTLRGWVGSCVAGYGSSF